MKGYTTSSEKRSIEFLHVDFKHGSAVPRSGFPFQILLQGKKRKRMWGGTYLRLVHLRIQEKQVDKFTSMMDPAPDLSFRDPLNSSLCVSTDRPTWFLEMNLVSPYSYHSTRTLDGVPGTRRIYQRT